MLTFGTLSADSQVIATIMAGGSGTRFWPLSRKAMPKQFLPLSPDGETLIKATADRMRWLNEKSSTLVVTAKHQVHLVQQHVAEAAILAEPAAKNTAPCIGYAATRVLREVGDVPMLCLPADHLIQNLDGLISVYERAIALARREDVIVLIGIPPSYPETGYGYIRAFDVADNHPRLPAYKVEAFYEKPQRETAEQYLRSGDYYWNSGMFIFRPSVILNEIKRYNPKLGDSLEKVGAALGKDDAKVEQEFAAIEPISIDYAVMEKSDKTLLIPGKNFSWSDIGSWDAWMDSVRDVESQENVARGNSMLYGCKNTTAISSSKFIAGVGLDGVIIVETPDAILVCRKDAAQDVKKIVEDLEKNDKSLL